ncbi:MAG: Rieske (2Fe-2S) protein [Pseudomonadales bacterium]|nr:Rieske (2Fe-2S) protein [Pseudomonadales bacterium]MCP5185891.1 Rieske (2Fe-2S) protein [Pseudomonadales bacterium]
MPEQSFQPPYEGSRVDHVGTWQRSLGVSLERMFENALDWAHLPHLHASSFTSIVCLEAGPWGWRARATDSAGRESLLELRLSAAQRRWVTRNLEGPHAGAEIWTYVVERAAREIDVVVDFFVPGLAASARESVGRAYASLYATLYDEDEAMMVARQALLDRRVNPIPAALAPVNLGPAAELRLPMPVRIGGRELLVVRSANGYQALSARCPHMGAPLENAAIDAGEIVCPWHGFRFDVSTGVCRKGMSGTLASGFGVSEVAGEVWVLPTEKQG